MLVILWETPFILLFLIVLYNWFTNDYHVYYENMRNENEKSFAVCVVMNGTFPIFSESATNRIRILDNTNHNVLIGNYMPWNKNNKNEYSTYRNRKTKKWKTFVFLFSYLWGVKEKGALSKNKQKYLPTQETTISVKMKLWNAKITQTSKQVADVHIVPSVFNWKNTRELIMNVI